ncbi:uncharacterized protein isoform X2 [Leptinotarsa decemlineata]|uniref:uncharacterized protein isoform X2 n=1 Tax=Leptinotarsa decemlineata TaxID=7539 RepID=UPI003D30662D
MSTDNCGRLIKEEEECNAVGMIISKYESEPNQVKSEDVIDVVNHDLKCERYLEEVKEASHCQVCGGGLFSPTDFFSPDHSKFCCNCQCQNGANAMQGEDMTLDLKPLTSGNIHFTEGLRRKKQKYQWVPENIYFQKSSNKQVTP